MKTLAQLMNGCPIEWASRLIGRLLRSTCDESLKSPISGEKIFFITKEKNAEEVNFLPLLVDSGISLVVAPFPRPVGCSLDWIFCPDVRSQWALSQREWHGRPDEKLHLFAVTGTNGKTTTAFALHHFLPDAARMTTIDRGFGGNFSDSSMTTPDAADFYAFLARARECNIKGVAFEASSHGLLQSRIFGCQIHTAIFTNLTHEHLDTHGSMEAYFDVKCRLFDGRNGPIPRNFVLNVDDEFGRRLLEKFPQAKTVGMSDRADYRLILRHSDFVCRLPGGDEIMLPRKRLLAPFNGLNLLSAFASLDGLLSREELLSRLEAFTLPPGRCQPVPLDVPCFVDYAHTPQALQEVISAIRLAFPDRPCFVAFGCGGNRDREKRPLMARVACAACDHVFFTSDNSRNEPFESILAMAKRGSGPNFSAIDDRRLALGEALRRARTAGGVLLVAGKGCEKVQEIAGCRRPFSDVEVLLDYQNERA